MQWHRKLQWRRKLQYPGCGVVHNFDSHIWLPMSHFPSSLMIMGIPIFFFFFHLILVSHCLVKFLLPTPTSSTDSTVVVHYLTTHFCMYTSQLVLYLALPVPPKPHPQVASNTHTHTHTHTHHISIPHLICKRAPYSIRCPSLSVPIGPAKVQPHIQSRFDFSCTHTHTLTDLSTLQCCVQWTEGGGVLIN